jgi:murein L,D-transpeptidase YcbB/YkuD
MKNRTAHLQKRWLMVVPLVYLSLFPLLSHLGGLDARADRFSGSADANRQEGDLLECARGSLKGEFGALADTLNAYYVGEYPDIWCRKGHIEDRTKAWIDVLKSARAEGLDPERYWPPRLQALFDRVDAGEEGAAAKLEVFLTAYTLRYLREVSSGRIDPREEDIPWYTQRESLPLMAVLTEMSRTGASGIRRLAAELPPPHRQYRDLRRALRRYREIEEAGGWLPVPGGEVLEPGERAPPARIRRLEERLAAEGFVPPRRESTARDSAALSGDLSRILGRFQALRGAEDDGVLGPRTLRELNVSVDERIRLIELNMERWRWMPRSLETKYILVNTAAFLLEGWNHGRRELEMKVIAGKTEWPTPAFSDRITAVIFNPEWNVPESIATREIAPEMLEDGDYVEENNMVVIDPETDDVIDPDDVDWEEAAAGHLKVRIRQRSGPGNPLGRVKFLFPNTFSVYLHDTPEKSLFDRTNRALSHGCIRVGRSLDLAFFVLESSPEWPRERIENAFAGDDRTQVNPEDGVPVYILYWTAFVNDAGEIEFRRDRYGIDAELANRLPAAGGGNARGKETS